MARLPAFAAFTSASTLGVILEISPGAAALAPPADAPAAPSEPLAWTGSVGCPGPARPMDELERWIGARARKAMGSEGWAVEVTSSDEPTGHVLRLWLHHPGGDEHRELRSVDCPSLNLAGLLVVAVAVAPVDTTQRLPEVSEERRSDVDRDPLEPPGAPDPHDPLDGGIASSRPPIVPAAPRVPRAVPADAARPRSARRHRPWSIGIGSVTGIGTALVPPVAAVLGLEAHAQVGRLRFGVDGWSQWGAPLEPADSDGRVRVIAWSTTPHVCFAPRVGEVEVPLCVGGDLGAVRARASGFAQDNASTTLFWASAVSSVRPTWWVRGNFGLALALDGFVSLTRPRLVYNEGETLHRTPPGGVRASVRLQGRFSVTRSAGSRQ